MNEFLAPFDVPMNVHLVEGEIVVLGPDGVAVSMTIDAAAESAKRLQQAVADALAGQGEAPPPSEG